MWLSLFVFVTPLHLAKTCLAKFGEIGNPLPVILSLCCHQVVRVANSWPRPTSWLVSFRTSAIPTTTSPHHLITTIPALRLPLPMGILPAMAVRQVHPSMARRPAMAVRPPRPSMAAELQRPPMAVAMVEAPTQEATAVHQAIAALLTT